jgi:hypothetical protein
MNQVPFDVLAYLVSLWEGIFSTPIAELNGVQVGILVLAFMLGWQVLKVLFETSKKGVATLSKTSKKVLFSFSPKARAAKTVCLHCGRTLDKCVCPSNKNLSLSKRLKKHKLEAQAAKLTQKLK